MAVRDKDEAARTVDRLVTEEIERVKRAPTPPVVDSSFEHRIFMRPADKPRPRAYTAASVTIKPPQGRKVK
jgi:hypothetical protein